MAKFRTRVKNMTTKHTFVLTEQTRKIKQTTPMKTRKKPGGEPVLAIKSIGSEQDRGLPKPALNDCVTRPVVAACPSAAKYEKAANDGVSVPAKVSQKAPKVRNTTAENVLPSTHSRKPLRTMRTPPKNQ